jgi:4'-phosphopantetheinyl transferase
MLEIWFVDLSDPRADAFDWFLSDEEITRIGKMRQDAPRRRWQRSRVALRCILANALSCEPDDVGYTYGRYGKPVVSPASRGGKPIHFSLTRSSDLCLICASDASPVGIDVERITDLDHLDRVSGQFLSPSEFSALSGLTDEHRFFRQWLTWTQKEAAAKVIGVGLQMPPHDLPSALQPLESVAKAFWSMRPKKQWRFVTLMPAPGYLGSLACDDADVRAGLRFSRFNPSFKYQSGEASC